MQRRVILLSILILAVATPLLAGDFNSSIRIDAGEVADRDLSTLNGGIRIGDGATVNGEAESVNGGIEIGRDARVESVSAVNGGVEIGAGTMIDGDVETVNGPIEMESGSSARNVGTVNDPVKLVGADVEMDVSTYNGDVTLSDQASVGGNIVIKEANSRSNRRDQVLHIYIEDGSTVQGDVIVEDKRLKVEVHLRGGTVAGEIRGATIAEK